MRRSPTLELAAAIDAARARGEPAYTLSNPSFPAMAALALASGGERPATALTPARGLDALRERGRQALLGKWYLPDHQCFVSAGAKAALFSALRGLCDAGEAVLIVAPCWPSYLDLGQLAHLQTVVFRTEFEHGFAIDPARLAQTLRLNRTIRAIILSNPCNPTGKIYSGEELARLAETARRYGVWLIVDESFSGIVFEPAKWRHSVCPAFDRLIVINSFSKNYHLQGLRLGLCAAPAAAIESIIAVHQTVVSSAPSLSQALALRVLEQSLPAVDYGRQRALLLKFVEDKGWPCLPTEGTFYCFPRIKNMAVFSHYARSRGLFFLAGEPFSAPQDHVRLCFGKPLPELQTILALLADFR